MHRQKTSRVWWTLLMLGVSSGLGLAWTAQATEPASGGRSISTLAASGSCADRLGDAMRDLQADVTGPLEAADYARIRRIFAPLCDSAEPVLRVDERGRRISTAPLSDGQGANVLEGGSLRTRSGLPTEPLLLLDVDAPRARPRRPR